MSLSIGEARVEFTSYVGGTLSLPSSIITPSQDTEGGIKFSNSQPRQFQLSPDQKGTKAPYGFSECPRVVSWKPGTQCDCIKKWWTLRSKAQQQVTESRPPS